MANAYFYSNTAVATTLAGNISSGATSVSVAATTGFPASTPYVLAVDYGAATEELVLVTAAAGTSLTVTRGFGSTSAQAHSIGAVVRHVVNAVDLTDFRTHEAATAAVHGVAGTLVGTSDTQTLANKTLTAPTINSGTFSGGAMSGTFTGAHTYSGAVTMSGGGTLTGTFTGAPTLSGNVAFSGAPTFSGTATHTGELVVSNLIRGSRAGATDSQYEARATGDSVARWFIDASGKQWWGSGSTTVDTNVYRSAANELKTDDSFVVGGELTVSGGTTWTTYTPTINGAGSATYSTRTGYYYKIGKMVHFVAYLAIDNAGTGSAIVQFFAPTNIDRSTRQVVTGSTELMGVNGHSHAVSFTSGSGATFDRVRTYDGQNIIGSDLFSGGLLTFQGWYREA